MSITITINDNESYCDENCPELIGREDTYCQCIQDGKAWKECHVCHGTGIDPLLAELKDYPFELNVSNANFSLIWSSLGLPVVDCGMIRGQALLKSVESVMPALMLREDKKEARGIDFGVDDKRAERYIRVLKEIALEACKREQEVYWS